jgi:hypothetical protein
MSTSARASARARASASSNPSQQQKSKLRCETEVGDHMMGKEPLSFRLAAGLPLLCGHPAAWYRMAGTLTSVPAKLCERHVEMFQKRGYTVLACEEPKESA